MLAIDIDFQVSEGHLPDAAELQSWVECAWSGTESAEAGNCKIPDCEVSVCIVDAQKSQTLNKQYRSKNQSTNVLSFPAELEPVNGVVHLGDIVLCASVINAEAATQNKPVNHHWAHMAVHGMLHLQGFDHIDQVDAETMETMEIEILHKLGVGNPYQAS